MGRICRLATGHCGLINEKGTIMEYAIKFDSQRGFVLFTRRKGGEWSVDSVHKSQIDAVFAGGALHAEAPT